MNDYKAGTTGCNHDEVPPVEVIQVRIEAEILDAIKGQILEKHPELKDEVQGKNPLFAFLTLSGNRVVAVSSVDNETFVPGPDDKFAFESLINVAIVQGKGSNATGVSVGSKTEYIKWN